MRAVTLHIHPMSSVHCEDTCKDIIERGEYEEIHFWFIRSGIDPDAGC